MNKGNNLAVGLYQYTGVEEIEVKEDNANYKTENGILYSKDGTTLWYVPVAKTGEIEIAEGVTTIKSGAFFCGKGGGQRNQTITIPASVTEIDEQALVELQYLGSSKVTFAEGSTYEFKADGTVGKK